MNALDAAFRFHETALKVGSQRQQVIASNMANADTPQYKAVDVNFADALARATGDDGTSHAGSTSPVAHLTMVSTHAGHIDAGADRGAVVLSTADLSQKPATQNAIDGNTVDLDAERAAFADNTVRYEASFSFLNQQIKTLMSSIQS